MKRYALAAGVFLLLLLCCACGKNGKNAAGAPPEGSVAMRVIEGGGTERLVLAGEKNGDFYTADAKELTVYTDGEKADAADLKNGMAVTLDPGFELLETWPAQIKGATVRADGGGDKDGHGDLAGVYLQVLEDLWERDPALNDGASYVSVDLSDAPGGLTEGEKSAVAWIFAGRHNAEALQLSFEELKTNGYISDGALYWETGVLMQIARSQNGADSAAKVGFEAKKWRSGDGAVYFRDCSAKRGAGEQWEAYKVGSYAVS